MTNPLVAPEPSTSPEEGTTLLRSFTVRNYKSLVDVTLDLGRFNVFIGENGCGKSNLLEAFGMAAAGLNHRLTDEDLYVRGIRLARPSIVCNAFPESDPGNAVAYEVRADDFDDLFRFGIFEDDNEWTYLTQFTEVQRAKVENEARDSRQKIRADSTWRRLLEKALILSEQSEHREASLFLNDLLANALSTMSGGTFEENSVAYRFAQFGIYNLSTLVLRGLQVESRREPLGLHGEGLDVLIAQMSEEERAKLSDYARLVSWVEGLEIDTEGARKLQGYKPGRSRSELYFHDRFMAEDNRTFSAENANEGVLHVLFYLALFMSQKTPRLFAIDNIETALNPRLLRHLIKQLASMARVHGKQALVTTHNPAALDGLNLLDDDQRLFEVYRTDEGHTQVRRIKVKPDQGGEKLKLSEMWMRGMLGAIPTHF